MYDYRELTITLGEEPGQVEVRLGGTRVLARVTCQVVQPKAHRPTDGQLFFNVELSPMASPAFEVGRYGIACVQCMLFFFCFLFFLRLIN